MTAYATVPGPRIAYHLDGSLGVRMADGGWGVPGASYGVGVPVSNPLAPINIGAVYGRDNEWGLRALNNDKAVLNRGNGDWDCIIFPAPRDLHGIYVASYSSNDPQTYGLQAIQISADTTDGVDGTWTTVWVGNYPFNDYGDPDNLFDLFAPRGFAEHPDLLTPPSPGDWDGMIAVRVHFTNAAYRSIHLYGTSTEVDRLVIASDVGTPLDANGLNLGELYRNQALAGQFTVKNISPTLTANDVQVTIDGSPLYYAEGWTWNFEDYKNNFTIDGGAGPVTTFNVGDLGPGDVSQILDFNVVIDTLTTLYPADIIIKAVPTSWS